MKSEFDQEMDTLLRAHARRERVARTAQSDARDSFAPAAAHLDADEVSAYAEQALPAATRTRYATHLAACDSCRAQVVMLTRAAGVAEQLEGRAAGTVAVTSTSSWRERLATFFAPGAWRYALPLIALFVVSGGALWLVNGTRARRANESAAAQQVVSASRVNEAREFGHAQTDEKPAADKDASGSTNRTATTATNANANTTIDTLAPAKPSPTPPSGELLARNESQQKAAAARLDSPPPMPSPANADAPANLSQRATNQTGTNQSAGVGLNSQMNTQQTAQNVYAPVPPAAAPAQTEAPVMRAQTEAEEEKTRAGERDNRRDAQPTAKARSAKREGGEPRDEIATTRGPSKSAPAPTSQRPADDKDTAGSDEIVSSERRRRPDTAPGAGRAATEDAGEQRSVAGRQFRRQKSAWVDTAYRAGQATVNIRRASEQWRALIADEPELRRIADTLGGEVVVVWHGRAYRIKP